MQCTILDDIRVYTQPVSAYVVGFNDSESESDDNVNELFMFTYNSLRSKILQYVSLFLALCFTLQLTIYASTAVPLKVLTRLEFICRCGYHCKIILHVQSI